MTLTLPDLAQPPHEDLGGLLAYALVAGGAVAFGILLLALAAAAPLPNY